MKEPWRTELSSTQAMIEDSHLISTLELVKSLNVGMRSESTWKLDPKLKSYAHLKQPTEAEESVQFLPILTWSSLSKELSDDLNIYILATHSFSQSINWLILKRKNHFILWVAYNAMIDWW